MTDAHELAEAEALARMRAMLPEAISVLREIANGPVDSETRRDARRTLEKYGLPLKANEAES